MGLQELLEKHNMTSESFLLVMVAQLLLSGKNIGIGINVATARSKYRERFTASLMCMCVILSLKLALFLDSFWRFDWIFFFVLRIMMRTNSFPNS